MTASSRNELERELITPPFLKDQFLNVLKAGFENLGDGENAKLYRFLRQLQLARESEKVSKEEQKLYEDITRLCDEATKLPMGSGEEAITRVWFKADNRSRRILYPAMVDLAERFGWDFRRSQALLELQRGKNIKPKDTGPIPRAEENKSRGAIPCPTPYFFF